MKRHIILHTHWDREWYFTTSDSLVLMDQTFKNVINELELYPEISFCLDGQYSIIEEFLNINPQLEAQVSKLVREKRLQIGPWHTQTDTQLVAAESIVRNLYYGMNQSLNRFGQVMKLGYLPDTFGFCHQMPEIYNLAGINKAVFWRGAEFKSNDKPYFYWQGAGGSTVKTINLFGGYGMAKGFSTEEAFIDKTLKTIIKNYQELGIDGDIVIPVGNDQFEIKADVPQKIKQINHDYQLNLEVNDYETSIEQIFKHQELPTYLGEFRKTAYTRLHKSIGSVRYDLKKANFEVESLLINEIEPLFIIAKQFAIKPSINLLYQAWSLLFEGHAHDGICGCISDAVYDDMINRIKRAREIGESLKNLILKQIAEKLSLNTNQILLINPSSYVQNLHQISVYTQEKEISFNEEESTIISTEIYDSRDDALVETATGNIYEEIPEMYCHQVLVKKEMEPLTIAILEFTNELKKEENKGNYNDSQQEISNQTITITVNQQKINLKIRDLEYQDVISLIDCGNDGDTYDYSPLKDDQEIKYEIISVTKQVSDLHEELRVKLKALLPYSLTDRIDGKNLEESIIELRLRINQCDDQVKCKVKMENNVLSHKLVVRLNLGNEIQQTISSSAYGEIMREVQLDSEINNWQANNVEKPVCIETFDGFIRSNNNDLLIISSFGKEYQAHNNFIDLTIFATTGELGKSNLINRPGRASGDVTKKGHVRIETPKAQCLGNVEYAFALCLGDNDYFNNMKKVYQYRTNTVNYQIQDINKFANRIDNKLMEYRKEKSEFNYQAIRFSTNGLITSLGIGLDGSTIIRGVCNENHQFNCNQEVKSIDLQGNKRNEKMGKFKIFNYQLEEKNENRI